MVSHKWSQNKHEFAWKVQYIDQVYSFALTLKIMCNLEEYRPMLCLGPSAYKAVIEIWSQEIHTLGYSTRTRASFTSWEDHAKVDILNLFINFWQSRQFCSNCSWQTKIKNIILQNSTNSFPEANIVFNCLDVNQFIQLSKFYFFWFRVI